jgi:hypothetical protein
LGRLSFTNTATTNTAQRLVIIDGVRGADANSGYLQFYTANSGNPAIRMTITSGGNVGIGTSSPTQKLDVVISSGPYNARFHNSSTSTSDYNVILVSQGASGSATGYFGTGGSAASNTSFANTFVIGTQSNSAFVFNTNDAERMRITSGGNVGIGTTNPTEKLDISGTGDVKAIVQTTSSGSGANTALGVKTAADGNWLIQTGNAISSGLRFYDVTNSAERMRITSGGQVLIGSSSNVGVSGLLVKQTAGTNQQALALWNTATSGTIYLAEFGYSSTFTAVGSITTDGTNTSYNTSSDYRLKQNLKDFNGLSLVNQINVYDYQWKSDSTRSYGVMAHELQSVLPYAVTGVKDGEKMQGVDYSKIVPILIKSIQELKAEIETLKNK